MNKRNKNMKTKNITIKDIAKEAGLSPATVGRVVGGYGSVSEATRRKVESVMERLNYFPNAIAQSMKENRTKTIGLIVSNIRNPFYSTVVRAVEDTAHNYNYNVIICNSDEDINKELLYLKTLMEKRVDGLIVSSTYKISLKKFGKSLKKIYHQIPTVLIDREVDDDNLSVVRADNIVGTYEATVHLIKLGHTDIGILTASQDMSSMSQRIEGYKNALKEFGIPFDPKLIFDGEDVNIEGGYYAAKRLFLSNKKPTALIALNNLILIGAMKVMYSHNLSIPNDIAVLCWDDFDLAEIMDPAITVVSQPVYTMGSIATERLIKKITDKTHPIIEEENVIILKPKLVVRKSCGS